MYGLKKMLIEELKYLEDVIHKVKSEVSVFPEGYLRISNNRGRVRFYHCNGDRLGKYIPKDNKELPGQLAQKVYQETVIRKAETRLNQISRLLRDYADDEIEQIYSSMNLERQALIKPVEPTANQLLNHWEEETYKGKEFQDGTIVILSERGERVRSKSEKILADHFYRNKIPYKYEKPLLLKGYGTVYPDFTLFSPRLRKEIYWEHEGRMDDPVYARSAVKKIYGYEQNGIFEGERLILTYETEETVINTRDIERKLQQYYWTK
ncbi:MAG: hypothetical protein K6G81_01370 [Lachnospiraceae bacterium]|nr:hypothetical protein [Lachnospiraceae bacterium]